MQRPSRCRSPFWLAAPKINPNPVARKASAGTRHDRKARLKRGHQPLAILPQTPCGPRASAAAASGALCRDMSSQSRRSRPPPIGRDGWTGCPCSSRFRAAGKGSRIPSPPDSKAAIISRPGSCMTRSNSEMARSCPFILFPGRAVVCSEGTEYKVATPDMSHTRPKNNINGSIVSGSVPDARKRITRAPATIIARSSPIHGCFLILAADVPRVHHHVRRHEDVPQDVAGPVHRDAGYRGLAYRGGAARALAAHFAQLPACKNNAHAEHDEQAGDSPFRRGFSFPKASDIAGARPSDMLLDCLADIVRSENLRRQTAARRARFSTGKASAGRPCRPPGRTPKTSSPPQAPRPHPCPDAAWAAIWPFAAFETRRAFSFEAAPAPSVSAAIPRCAPRGWRALRCGRIRI